MKTKLFFIVLTFTIVLLAFSVPKNIDTSSAIVLESLDSQVILKTSNGCGIGNFIFPVEGDSSQSHPSVLMALSENEPSGYVALDTIDSNKILSVAFKRDNWQENSSLIESNLEFPYVVISDKGMYSYNIPNDFDPFVTELNKVDSLLISGIKKVANQQTQNFTNSIALFVEDVNDVNRVELYAYPSLDEQFDFVLDFEPEIFELIDDDLFITGLDSMGAYKLFHYSAIEENLFTTYELNEFSVNAQEILKIENDIFILSSPSDTSIILSKVNLIDSTFTQSVINSNSSARATHNEFKGAQFFTFQQSTDVNDILNRQIFVLNPIDNLIDTLFINLELDYFKYPSEVSQAFGFYNLSWVGATWNEQDLGLVYLNEGTDQNIIINTQGDANYINATYGCWLNVIENELEKIKFEFFPNPASSIITINLTGLVRGHPYKLDIVDSSGKLCYTTYLSAYEKIVLPIEDLNEGIYFLKLDTGRNLISQKLMIQ